MSSTRAFLLTATLLAAGLSACAVPGPLAEQPRTPTEQFKATVTAEPVQLTLNPHAELSSAQRAALYDMITRWRSAPAGPIVVETAAAGGDQAAGRVSAFLADHGVRPPEVSFRRYEGAAGAPIKVSFPLYRAEIPRCGESWESLARLSNQVQSNFGCATAANIAAMVANPADLVSPPADTGPDATRRQVLLEKYRAGDNTASAAGPSASTKQ